MNDTAELPELPVPAQPPTWRTAYPQQDLPPQPAAVPQPMAYYPHPAYRPGPGAQAAMIGGGAAMAGGTVAMAGGGMAAAGGTAVAATGAAVAGGSVFLGIMMIMFGGLLSLTIIGALVGIPLIILGISTAGFGAAAGGTAMAAGGTTAMAGTAAMAAGGVSTVAGTAAMAGGYAASRPPYGTYPVVMAYQPAPVPAPRRGMSNAAIALVVLGGLVGLMLFSCMVVGLLGGAQR